VIVKLPVSSDATNPIIRTNAGSAEYAPEQEALLWKIKAFPGGKEYLLRAKFALPSVSADEETGAKVKRPPIKVSFEIPYFTVSGIQVRYLKVSEKSGYQALPWVRYITMVSSLSFSLRIFFLSFFQS
jgi:AP-1 complex subunit mu